MHFVSLSEYKKLPRRAAQVKMKESEAASLVVSRETRSAFSRSCCAVCLREPLCAKEEG